MKTGTYLFLALSVFLFGSAQASPNSFTYQGRILKSDGTPLEYNNVSFQFEVTSPNGQCILYREQIDHVDMTNSKGIFDVPIGGGTQSFPGNGTFTLADAFNNSGSLNCDGGSTYSASSGDLRKLRVKFFDGTGWNTISPDNVVRSVPFSSYAYSAEKLGSKSLSDLVLKTDINSNTNCGGGNSFLTWDATSKSFGCSSATVTGTASGDLTGSYPNPTVAKLQGVAVSTSTPTIGQVLKFDGTQWIASPDSNSGGTLTTLTGDVSASGSGSVAATVNSVGGSSAANVHSAEVAANAATNANTASTIVKRDASGNFSAGTITANLNGNVTGSVTGNLTGSASLNVLKAGDTMSGNLTFASGKGTVFTDSTTNTVSLQAPNTVTSYVLKFPAAQGSANQMLTNDGAGNLSWTSLSSLGVTSVAVTAPLTNSGTATAPNIGIQQANGSQNGYLSSADWTTFNNKQGTSLTSANIWVGNASNLATAIAPSGDLSMTNAGAFTVTGIQGKTVSATTPSAAGQVLRYDGTGSYIPAFLGLADIRSTITPFGGAFANSACGAGQSMYWQSSTDSFQCQPIAINDSQLSFTTSRAANTFLAAPSTGAGAASFRTIASSDLPTGTLSGSGTAGYIPYYSGASTLANSPLYATASKVGIGTTGPWDQLTIYKANALAGASITSDNTSTNTARYPYLNIVNFMGAPATGNGGNPSLNLINMRGNSSTSAPMKTGESLAAVTFNGASDAAGNYIEGAAIWATSTQAFSSTAGGTSMSFYTTANNTTVAQPRVLIDQNGYVGIGTTTPTQLLSLLSPSSSRVKVETTSTTGTAQVYFLRGSAETSFGPDASTIDLWSSENLPFTVTLDGANEIFRITPSGNVGVGTSTPQTKLDVSGEVKLGNTNSTCSATNEGSQRYNSSSKNMEFCNGSSWVALATAGVPSGAVQSFAGSTCPSGWLKANGQAVSRTTYANLFAYIGTSYGAGDGSTTFNVPELRGEFIRGWDDGRGVDSGRAIASTQTQDLQPHSHTISTADVYNSSSSAPGAFIINDNSSDSIVSADNISPGSNATSRPNRYSTGGTGTTETRPRNVALLYCIKF